MEEQEHRAPEVGDTLPARGLTQSPPSGGWFGTWGPSGWIGAGLEGSWGVRVAFNPFSMEDISGLEPPILYVFPSLPKSPNTNHTRRGKRPGKKYAEKKNLWKNKKEQHSEPPQSGSLGGVCTEQGIIHSSPKSSRSLPPAWPSLGAAGGSGPHSGDLWDLLSGPGACHEQGG